MTWGLKVWAKAWASPKGLSQGDPGIPQPRCLTGQPCTLCSVQLRIGSPKHHCFQAGCVWMHVTSLSPIVKVQGCPFRGASVLRGYSLAVGAP